MSAQFYDTLGTKPSSSRFALIVSFAALIFTWLMVGLVFLASTETYLAPWDLWDLEDRPPIGAMARTVNDFFEGAGAFIPLLALVGVSVVLFVRAMRAARSPLMTIATFILSNLALYGAFAITMGAASAINGWLFPPIYSARDVGFHRSIVPLTLFAGMSAVYFFVQWRAGNKH